MTDNLIHHLIIYTLQNIQVCFESIISKKLIQCNSNYEEQKYYTSLGLGIVWPAKAIHDCWPELDCQVDTSFVCESCLRVYDHILEMKIIAIMPIGCFD